MTIPLMQYGPVVVGLAFASLVWLLRRRSWPLLSPWCRGWTAVGLLVVLVFAIVWNAWVTFPAGNLSVAAVSTLFDLRFAFPLVLCLVALALLLPTARNNDQRGGVELSRRTLATFVPLPWAIFTIAALTAVLAVTVLAGTMSRPDEDGRYLIYEVDAATGASGSTTIYGWFYSVLCLVLIAVIVALVLVQLELISRPALAIDRDADITQRTARARNLLSVSAGGLLLHLGAVLLSLYGTSTVRIGFDAGTAGWAEVGASFADLGPLLLVASYISVATGFTLWCLVLLSVVAPASKRHMAEMATA
ncbi:hypothetical protein [Agromyces sp. LHK192]|uniref:hypothetical protein n=1 Tax=Agromyces sp. LHK192 TaxID=2498704 RepID=UPI000FDA6520|nr:hypothetical protein [Agromyces sp. LHK192]